MGGWTRMRVLGVVAALAMHNTLLCAPMLVTGRFAMSWSDPHVAAFVMLANVLCLLDVIHISQVHAGAPRPGIRDERWIQGPALATGLAVLATFWLGLIAHADCSSITIAVPHAIGAALMIVGLLLRGSAMHALGRHFVTSIVVEPRQVLMRHGVFAFVRHPSEAGNLLVTLGACVLLETAGGLVAWLVVIVPLVVLRIRREDRLLVLAFGGEFRAYRKRVRAVVPYLI